MLEDVKQSMSVLTLSLFTIHLQSPFKPTHCFLAGLRYALGSSWSDRKLLPNINAKMNKVKKKMGRLVEKAVTQVDFLIKIKLYTREC